MALVDQYQKPADDLVDELMDACRVGDATRGSIVTATVFHARDINLLMMVLGGLSAKAVMAEQAAQKAHGPLIQPRQHCRGLGDESITLQHVVRAMMVIDQQTVSVLAAEALLRLFKLYEDQDE